jgi:hypothetical protein
MEQDSNLQGAAKAQPFSKRPPHTDGASPSGGKCRTQNDECRIKSGWPSMLLILHSAFIILHSAIIASYGTRTRSNTVTGCRADPHTDEALSPPGIEPGPRASHARVVSVPPRGRNQRMKAEGRRMKWHQSCSFFLLPSSFCLLPFLTAPARSRTWNSTFEASCDVRFHHRGAASPRPAPAGFGGRRR